MAESLALSTLTLPQDLDAADVLGFCDQINARIAAVLRPKGSKRKDDDVTLPEGLESLGALPPHIDRPWTRFNTAAAELLAFRGMRASVLADQAHAVLDEAERSAANANADDRWRALEQWNEGAAGLSDDGEVPAPSEARWLYAQLFPAPTGIRFITYRPRAQWTAMVQRMNVLQGDRAQAVLAGFHGARHMKQLAAAHARFGNAFGFTTAVVEPAGGPTDGRQQWLAAREALRTLVQKVESYADPEIPGSQELAAFLLGPYIEMVDGVSRNRRPVRPRQPEPLSAPLVVGTIGLP